VDALSGSYNPTTKRENWISRPFSHITTACLKTALLLQWKAGRHSTLGEVPQAEAGTGSGQVL
jgi:hypothetical protein